MNEHDLLCGVADSAEALLATQIIPATPAAKQAWGDLRAKIDALRGYQAHGNESDRPKGVRSRPCEHCFALIFFAQEGYTSTASSVAVVDKKTGITLDVSRSGRWIPFELEPIDAADVLPSWMWVIDFNGVVPVARTEPTRTGGRVYVDHRQTCGTGNGPKHRCAPYQRRWKVNVERVNADTNSAAMRAAQDLVNMRNRYGRKPDEQS